VVDWQQQLGCDTLDFESMPLLAVSKSVRRPDLRIKAFMKDIPIKDINRSNWLNALIWIRKSLHASWVSDK
jgi:hypothetical protein